MMLINKIREVTSEQHKKTDNFLYPFFKAIETAEDYIKILKAFYAFFHPVMNSIDRHLNKTRVNDYAERRKTGSLAADLEHFGVCAQDIEPAEQLPTITGDAEAMGAYYVLEGSTLGGVFLSGMIAERLGITDSKGISFFSGYGGNSKNMWNRFLSYLEDYDNDEKRSAVIADTAEQTFRLFYEHLQQCFEKQ